MQHLGGAEYADALRVWQRHERARHAGAPIVSVWIGDAIGFEHALARPVVWSSAASLDACARDWWREIAARRNLSREAFRFLASELGESEQELWASWSARALRERRMWLEQHEAPRLHGAVELLGSTLALEEPIDFAPGLGRLLAWLPAPECLGIANPDALRGALSLAVEAPHVALLAQIESSAWLRLSAQLDDRTRTLLEQGLISRKIESSGTEQRLQLALDAARAARSSGAPDAAEIDSRARSAAEQRLYELLDQDPVTHGLFVLNERLPFTFGNARAEVDLVCTELRLAVEVDGYFHFQDSDAYRRDRRKDVLLQHQGYMVSRHLAEDVERRAPEVVRAIRELVKRRRRRRHREKAG